MVLIYKTDIDSRIKIDAIKPYMNEFLPNSKWTVDIEDCDNVLRIETSETVKDSVIIMLHKLNHYCAEL